MKPHPRARVLVALSAVAVVAAACASSSGAAAPAVGGTLGFDQNVAVPANGAIPTAMAGLACGSDTSEFGVELLNTDPQNAKVRNEWGEIVPGHQMYMAGTVQDVVWSTGDLTFDHPYGKDLTLDFTPDRPYAALAQMVGTGPREGAPPGSIHWEIQRGLVPQSSPDTYLDGFVPQAGDRIATYGHWIIDCGHDDFHAEIHPPTFVSFARRQGSATVVHAYYNPYYEDQLYTPDPSLAAALGNTARLTDPSTQSFPKYLFNQLLRLAHVGSPGTLGFLDRLEAHSLLEANRASPITWYACAPGPKPSGASLSVSDQLETRPGVTVTTTKDESTGCAGFTMTIGKDYQPLDPVRKDCVDPWSDLNQQAQAALGNSSVDILKAIQQKVPKDFWPAVAKDPVVDCYDPLVVPAPSGTGVTASATQPYPLYGTITVAWSK